ncbi:LexA family protein [Flavobacterium sp.]|uniref:LexA family protein n=1 Tax=Flavobacterium sp. TaxID=239 RepID=UPI004034307E
MFESPANDFLEQYLDLNKLLVKHPNSTFFMWLGGEGFRDAGIGKGDLLIIDRSLDAANGALAVCVIDGEFLLRRIFRTKAEVMLLANDNDSAPVPLAGDIQIWGIVKCVVKMRV